MSHHHHRISSTLMIVKVPPTSVCPPPDPRLVSRFFLSFISSDTFDNLTSFIRSRNIKRSIHIQVQEVGLFRWPPYGGLGSAPMSSNPTTAPTRHQHCWLPDRRRKPDLNQDLNPVWTKTGAQILRTCGRTRLLIGVTWSAPSCFPTQRWHHTSVRSHDDETF